MNDQIPLKQNIQKLNKESNEFNLNERFPEKKQEIIYEKHSNKFQEKSKEKADPRAFEIDSKSQMSKHNIKEEKEKNIFEKNSKNSNVKINNIPINSIEINEERNDQISASKFNNNRIKDLRNYDNFDDIPSSPDAAHRQAIQNTQNNAKEKNSSIFEKQINSKEDAQKALSELLAFRLGNNYK